MTGVNVPRETSIAPPRKGGDLIERVRWLERELERCQRKLSNLRRDVRQRDASQLGRGRIRDARAHAEVHGPCESCGEPATAVIYLDGRLRWGRHGHRWCLEHLLE